MKKYFLSLLVALCLTVAAPAVFAAGEADLQSQIDSAADGAVIVLSGDVTVGSTLTINKPLTIDGANHKLTYTGSGAAAAASTNGQLTLKNLKIDAVNVNGKGVSLSGSAPRLTLDNCVLTVGNRGVDVFPASYANGAAISVLNSTIQCSRIPSDKTYDNWACVGDTRGLSLTDLKAAQVTIDNSTIQGFGYSVNINGHDDASGVSDNQGTVFTIKNSAIRGWAALNIWCINSTYNITNSHLIGINVADSGQNGFSTIALNNGIYAATANKANVFNVKGGSIEAYKYSASSQISENLIRVEAEGQSKFNFTRGAGKVALYANETAYGAFITAYPGMSDSEMANWFSSHVTGWSSVTANVPPYVGYAARTALEPYIPHEGGKI